ncbi:alpha-1,3-glucosyltransferase [Monoraphidium neglectum]|uniref:Alpha-1,3-glucosyltransferase n=1 Tax=Monoraphidium neglectum TaxID=145388 RepID=A0A0D2LIM6_9CHLO|nr:alpha-1,3-glucosyltransferase [Monoraphidium neglectum]KIZ06304.1 alpha-1,3-glucosyltransferase [Monoraphidium neglectum]|eukprot:XP_013905323.1 alpha-1,3-glucosyltransferase [Monoraphidium neglectum]
MVPLARLADPKMLALSNLEYDSPATVLFQRASVSATGLVLAAAAWYATRGPEGSKPRAQLLFFLLVANSGLLLVDHIHFQYNGILLGIMVWSLLLAQERRYVASGILFAVLLNMKHLFAYMAPAYFVFLLRNHCLGGEAGAPPLQTFVARLSALGAAVVAVFAASLGPFIATGQLPQLLSRLFPFGRGLCHAYWAPNAWALYSFGDKVLAALLAKAGLMEKPVAHMAGGIVGTAKFAVLPQ